MKPKLLVVCAAMVAALLVILNYRHSPLAKNTPLEKANVSVAPESTASTHVGEAGSGAAVQNSLPSDRRAEIEEGVRFVYGRTVRGLRLSASDEAKVWAYLIQRTEAGQLARQVARERQVGNDLPKLIAIAQQQVDDEAQQSISPLLFNQLKLMVHAGLYLNELNQSYSQALASGGVPLDDSQMLPMAAAFLSTYGSPGNPTTDPKLAGVDAHGLMPADYKLLDKAADVLSPKQLLVFEAELKNKNAKLLNAKN